MMRLTHTNRRAMPEDAISDFTVLVHSPLYLIRTTAACFKCERPHQVVGFAATEIEHDGDRYGDSNAPEELFLLSRVVALPEHVLAYVQGRHPCYQLTHSQTANFAYFANLCECGVIYGDHYLFSEPGGAFFPETPETAAQIEIIRLQLEGRFEFDCSWSYGSAGELILENGRRVEL